MRSSLEARVAEVFSPIIMSRRDALLGTLAIAAVPWNTARSALATPPLVRQSITGADFSPATLESFKRAIRAMLALPPNDPRNWYRQAIIHVLDCPHANWWFLPWHRGYLLHFEEICRELSADPKFALPFWDWTSTPRVPAALFDDVLSPTHELYEESFETFRPKFETAIGDLWNGLTAAQRDQLNQRGYASVNDLWAKLESYFSARAEARAETREKPELPDWAMGEVSAERVTAALAPTRFEDFGSTPSENHHQRAILDTLESSPHNNIHNAVGGGSGFMSELLAPVDPIFWLHHANIDRLWDLWTTREQRAGRRALPEDTGRWRKERFLFFTSGESFSERYVDTGELGYRYSEGFGAEMLKETPGAEISQAPTSSPSAAKFEGEQVRAPLRTDAEASAAVRVPSDLLVAARMPKKKAGAHSSAADAGHVQPELVAQVSLSPPENHRAVRVLFFLNCSDLSPETTLSDPHYVGSVTFFGVHGTGHHTAQFTASLPLNDTLQRLAAAGEPVMNQVKLQGIAAKDGSQNQAVDGALIQVSVKTV
jgi:tyrosinase